MHMGLKKELIASRARKLVTLGSKCDTSLLPRPQGVPLPSVTLNVTLERNLALMMNSQPHLVSAENMSRLLGRVDFYKSSVIPATYTKDY